MAVVRGVASQLGAHQPLSSLLSEGTPRRQLVQLAARGATGFHRAEQSIGELARAAARGALHRAEHDPAEVDVLLFATNSARSPEFDGDVAHELLGALGLERAHTHGVGLQNCGDGALALRTAAALVDSGQARHVLIVIADKVCDAGVPRIVNDAYLHSDGASACLVSGGGSGYRIAATRILQAVAAPGQAIRADPMDIDVHLERFIEQGRAWVAQTMGVRVGPEHALISHNINRIFNHRLARAFGLAEERVLGRFTRGHCLASDLLMNLEVLAAAPTVPVWVFAPTHRSCGLMLLEPT